MKTIKLEFSLINEEERCEVILDFETQEIEILNKYLKNCDRLRDAPLLQNFPVIRSIKWNFEDGSFTFEISDFQYDQVYDLLHRARPIFLQEEPASFHRVKAIFGKKSKRTVLAKWLKGIRSFYEKGDYQPYFQIYISKDTPSFAQDQIGAWLDNTVSEKNQNVIPLFQERTLDAWLNGVEYHQDQDKAEKVESLEESLTREITRGIFVSQLSGRLRAIFHLEKLSRLVVDYKA